MDQRMLPILSLGGSPHWDWTSGGGFCTLPPKILPFSPKHMIVWDPRKENSQLMKHPKFCRRGHNSLNSASLGPQKCPKIAGRFKTWLEKQTCWTGLQTWLELGFNDLMILGPPPQFSRCAQCLAKKRLRAWCPHLWANPTSKASRLDQSIGACGHEQTRGAKCATSWNPSGCAATVWRIPHLRHTKFCFPWFTTWFLLSPKFSFGWLGSPTSGICNDSHLRPACWNRRKYNIYHCAHRWKRCLCDQHQPDQAPHRDLAWPLKHVSSTERSEYWISIEHRAVGIH